MEWVFEVVQGGIVVAEGSGLKEACLAEAAHYVRVYGQDGECKAYVYPEDKPSPVTNGERGTEA